MERETSYGRSRSKTCSFLDLLGVYDSPQTPKRYLHTVGAPVKINPAFASVHLMDLENDKMELLRVTSGFIRSEKCPLRSEEGFSKIGA